MPCELVSIDFRTKKVLDRQTLDGQAPEYRPLKDQGFKDFTAALADLALHAHEFGANPRRLIGLITDESVDYDVMIYDETLVTDEQAISALERLIEKLRAQTPDPEVS